MRFPISLLLAAILVAACSGSAGAPPPAEVAIPGATPATETRPGNPVVYERIEAMTDCAELQESFDIAANGPARPWKVPYMDAADGRMAELGCYK